MIVVFVVGIAAGIVVVIAARILVGVVVAVIMIVIVAAVTVAHVSKTAGWCACAQENLHGHCCPGEGLPEQIKPRQV